MAGDGDDVGFCGVGSGEVVEELFAVVVEEEVDFVEDDYCMDDSGFFFKSALEV